MDEDRQIRFVIPPFFLLGSLLWGAFLAGIDISPLLKPDTAKELFGLLAATAVAILPLGFLISTVSIILIRVLTVRKPTYEASFSDGSFGKVWTTVGRQGPPDKKQILYAAATFDHELLSDGVHAWLMRRWNAFNVSAHSLVALLLAHALAPSLSVPQTGRWWSWTIGLVLLLALAAIVAWRQTMAMLEFQVQRRRAPATTSTVYRRGLSAR